MKRFRSASIILTCSLLAACQDLTIEDRNRPSLAASLGTATNLETTVGSAAKYFFGGVAMGFSINQSDGSATFVPILEGWNDAVTFGGRAPTLAATTVLDEPRATFDHNSDQFFGNKGPYQDSYAAIANCHDVRQAILAGKNGNAPLQGAAFPQSARAAYFCKIIMGLGHLYVGTIYDIALLVPDDLKDIELDNRNFVAHDSVVEFSKTMIREGIEEAKAAPYSTTLSTWINGVLYSNVDMAKIAYGYLARAEIFKAATKEQRADISKGGVVDWARVVRLVDSSLTSSWTVGQAPATIQVNNTASAKTPMLLPNFTIKGTSTSSTTRNADLHILMFTGANNYYRMHHKVLGPADTTGAYVEYLKTPVGYRNDTTYASPDKRLPKGPCMTINGVKQTYGTSGCLPRHGTATGSVATTVEGANQQDGNYFQLFDQNNVLTFNTAVNNSFRRASYMFIRFGNVAAARRSVGSTTGIMYLDFQSLMTPEEHDLMRAESYMRLGSETDSRAITIINKTRTAVAKGGLPALTAAGAIAQPYPQCVPHDFADAEKCGDIWDALLWEKRMEQMGTEVILNWSDWRSFGMLDPGTPVFFPPSWREIGQMGLPYYTYGGPLPGSSDSKIPCGTDKKVFQNIGCTDYQSVGRLPKPPL